MTSDSPTVFERLKCRLLGHERVYDRAEDREEGGYQRLYAADDRDPEPIPACYIVNKCQRCGDEQRIYASVETAERIGVTLAWRAPCEQHPQQNQTQGQGQEQEQHHDRDAHATGGEDPDADE